MKTEENLGVHEYYCEICGKKFILQHICPILRKICENCQSKEFLREQKD